MLTHYRRGWNYISTLSTLIHSYIKVRGFKAILAVLLVSAVGLLQPLPLAMLAQLPAAASRGESAIQIPKVGIALPLAQAMPIVLGAIVAMVVLSYLAERYVLRQVSLWQDHLFFRQMEEAANVPRTDRHIRALGPGNEDAYVFETRIGLRAGIVVGRLLSVGLRDALTIVACVLMLTLMDFATFFLIVLSVVAFIPFYSQAARRLEKARSTSLGIMGGRRAKAAALIREVAAAGPGSRIVDRAGVLHGAVRGEPSSYFSSLFDMPNRLIGSMLSFNLIAGLNLVAVLLAVYFWNGADVTLLLHQKLAYFVLLLLFVKSMRGLSAILGRMTRAYDGLSIMREMIEPHSKPLWGGVAKGGGVRFILKGPKGSRLEVADGTPVHVLMPPVTFPLHLIPLSNALRPLRAVEAGRSATMLLLDEAVVALIAGVARKDVPAPAVASAAARGDFCVEPAGKVTSWERCVALAIGEAAWRTAAALGVADRIRDGRAIFILADGSRTDFEGDGARPLAVINDQGVVALGTFESVYAPYRESVAAWRPKSKYQVLEDEEEML
jgi:hypothetical protein